MDFFTQQDKARRNTSLLVVMFIAAVFMLIALSNLAAYVLFWYSGNHSTVNSVEIYSQPSNRGSIWDGHYSWEWCLAVSGSILGVILMAALFKWVQLSSGGKSVATALGGVRISPNTSDLSERQVLNVVEEMALAAGMPVPPVYLLNHERGINAFAAGNTPADAVIGVTQGCVTHFNRAELQGVVAHEFSHILNGDMRLNIRLMGLLHGILFLSQIGEFLARSDSYHRPSYGLFSFGSRSRDQSSSGLTLIGLIIMAIGWLGVFFGNMIKAAVSRQREFLADASAVQFTRNPEGIRDALRVIGGSHAGAMIEHAHASEASHLFFGQALGRLYTVFDTHPPLPERIARIDAQWNGQYIVRRISDERAAHGQAAVQAEQDKKAEKQHKAAAVLTAASQFALGDDTALMREQIDGIPPMLIEHAHDPLGANALIVALLLCEDDAVRKKQLHYIEHCGVAGLFALVNQLASEIMRLHATWRLPLVELSLPALKCLSKPQYRQFMETLLRMVRADNRIELYEWCLYHLIKHYLAADYGEEKPSRPKYKKVAEVAEAYQLVLSLLAHNGRDDLGEAERAYSRGANTAGLYTHAMLNAELCQLNQFIKAVNRLAHCYPLLKPRLLKGFADCVKHDGKITPLEKEMVAAIAAVMDCPMPAIVV